MPDTSLTRETSSVTRREFTVQSVLALLSGCVITVSEGCGDSNTPTTPTQQSSSPTTDISGTISANHGHAATVTGAQITTGAAASLNIQGAATHPHTVTLSASDLTNLKNRQAVTVSSTTDNGHSHTVTFTPM